MVKKWARNYSQWLKTVKKPLTVNKATRLYTKYTIRRDAALTKTPPMTTKYRGHQYILESANLNPRNCYRTSNIYQKKGMGCLLYTSPSPRDRQRSRMPSSA